MHKVRMGPVFAGSMLLKCCWCQVASALRLCCYNITLHWTICG